MPQQPKGKLSVGIIGAGNVAIHRHIPLFKRDPRVRIIGITSEEGAPEVARKFNIPQALYGVEDLLNLRPDIVTICTPPRTHASLAIASMEQGCNVFVEKPMAMNSQEAAQMIETVSRCNRSLCVDHNFLFARSTQKALSDIEAGQLGALIMVSGIQLNSPRRQRRGLPKWCQELPGGLFFDDGTHMVYLFQRFLGPKLEVSAARAERALPGSIQPLKTVEVWFRGQKALGHLITAFESPISEWLVTIMGTKQVLMLDLFRGILIKLPPDGNHSAKQVLATSLRAMLQESQGLLASGIQVSLKRLFWGHEILIPRFIESVTLGTPPPIPATEGAETVAIMEEILRQAQVPQEHGYM